MFTTVHVYNLDSRKKEFYWFTFIEIFIKFVKFSFSNNFL